MIISFTGPQCTGKTTLLRACKEIYSDRYDFVDEVTRLVKRQFGVQINEAGNDLTQCLIINKHIENSLMSSEKQGIILDRCILDGLCYTGYLYIENKISKWVMDYAKGVYFKIIDKIDYIIYPDPSDVELVDDGERSIDVDFRNKMIETFETVIDGAYGCNIKNKIVRVKGTVEERMEAIKLVLCQQP
jgi:thymidylate kinase